MKEKENESKIINVSAELEKAKPYLDKFDKAKNFNSSRKNVYAEFMAFYQGNQYLLKKYKNETPWVVNMNTPHASIAIDNRVASLLANDYIGELIPLGIEDVDNVDKLAEVYNLMDVLAFPTLANESLGLVALEAMTTGVPVISSDIAAPSYYIKDGVNGYKFEVGNADRLAECIDRCISDPEKHKSLKTGALNTAQKYSSTEAENILGKLFIPGR